MSAHHAERADSPLDIREKLMAAVDHLEHVLPGQPPIRDFVHHNTLHGYQHLPFTEALEASEKLTGIRGYLPEEDFRNYYAQGRIDDTDLNASLENNTDGRDREVVLHISDHRTITKRDLWRIGLIYNINAISPNHFRWQVEEFNALERFQDDIPEAARSALLEGARETMQGRCTESEVLQDLWNACLATFHLKNPHLHPEELEEFPAYQTDGTNPVTQSRMLAEAREELKQRLDDVGKGLSLRGLLLTLTGEDLLSQVRPILIRFCASHLDEGLAAWSLPDRDQGLYAAWRKCASTDFALDLAELPDWWRQFHAELPEHSVDAVIACLERLRIPESRWDGYLKRIALELPGWSGLINWRHQRPEYKANQQAPTSLMDYLAIRLFLDVIWIEHTCQKNWGVAGNLDELKVYFEHNLAEFSGRHALFSNHLPEYLATRVQELIMAPPEYHQNWRIVASMIQAWKHSPLAERPERHTVYRSAWRLFRLAQHLGLSGSQVDQLSLDGAERLLAALDELTSSERGYIWLCAYEHHFRENILTALAQNFGRGRWARRDTRPEAQMIFCIDDREESIRRHLEEINPNIETLAAAGFFGVKINWRGLDDTKLTPLCPVVFKSARELNENPHAERPISIDWVTPPHEVREEPQPGAEKKYGLRKRLQNLRNALNRLLYQETRRNLLSSKLLIDLLSPGFLAVLAGKVFFPYQQATLTRKATAALLPPVGAELKFTAPSDSPAGTAEHPRLGFTDAEQAAQVAAVLRASGLTYGFAPLVLLAGHGSISQNNPHMAAYDCGACSGRHGGPNARVFAAMANRPEIRALLAEQGIKIPDDTWFIGTEHNTCSEEFFWYDLDLLPADFKPAYEKLKAEIDHALLFSAHERCRRLASAPRRPSLQKAMKHIVERSTDFSQVRPELGHATVCWAHIGRRYVTRGAFFDRRVFLVSYDPTQDPDGKILENTLMTQGVVGVGINLEYYFSTVDNERFGCGSKVPHNVTGHFAVMEGASSDLRTGLPRQMIEIHEAMRLLTVVESTPEMLTEIYKRQTMIQELVGGGWLVLVSMHPETGEMTIFDPKQGFVPWTSTRGPLPVVERSTEWYDGHSDPLTPALIEPKQTMETYHAV